MSLMDTFLTFLCESLTTTKSEGAADVKFQLGKDRNGISPLDHSLALVVVQTSKLMLVISTPTPMSWLLFGTRH